MKFLILLTLILYAIPSNATTFNGFTYTSKKILPVGDSITEGNTNNDPYWRDNLQDLLGIGKYDFIGNRRSPTSGFPLYDMDHAGVGGEQTTAILARIPALINDYLGTVDYNNTYILLHAGTNDCFQYDCTTITTALDNISSIIDLFRAVSPNIKILVALIIPSDKPAPDTNQNDRIQAFVPLLNSMLQAKQVSDANLIIVDMNAEFENTSNCATLSSCLITGGVHPNSTGSALMAAQWKRCIDNSANIGCNGN